MRYGDTARDHSVGAQVSGEVSSGIESKLRDWDSLRESPLFDGHQTKWRLYGRIYSRTSQSCAFQDMTEPDLSAATLTRRFAMGWARGL